MHVRTILAIARKDALDILLNKATLTMLLSPLFLAILFFGIGKLLGSHTTNALIYDPGKSGIEQIVKGAFSDSKITYANAPEDVTAAFGPDGSQKTANYALGLIIPENFDGSLRSGGHPALTLYVDGSQIGNGQRALLLGSFTDYSRSLANPQPPATITVATINPPKPTTSEQDLGQLYAVAIILSSLFIGSALVPGLLAEEKEKKTLRMLMVSPASFADVVAAKLLVGLVYQLLLTLVAVGIQGGYMGQIPLILLFIFLGSLFSITVGLLIGCFFQTTNATGSAAGMISFLYLLPVFFVGTFAQLLPNNPFMSVIKILPTYYIASGVSDAVSSQSTIGGTLLNVGITLGVAVLLFFYAVWTLRRQASVAATI